MPKNLLSENRFNSFNEYITHCGNGVSLTTAHHKARKGAYFLEAIQNGKPIKGTREENIANLVWFLTARSFGDKPYTKPMDAGMYTLTLETPEATKRLHAYFAGKNAVPHPYLRLIPGLLFAPFSAIINLLVFFKRIIIPAPFAKYPGLSGTLDGIAKLFNKRSWAFDENRTAYGRLSSHFDKLTKRSHFGYDITNSNKNQLPGKFNCVVFGLIQDKEHPTRFYFKPESTGADALNHPWEFIKHSMHYTGVKGVHANEVTAKEKVQNQDIIKAYLAIMDIKEPTDKSNKKELKKYKNQLKTIQKLNVQKMREKITAKHPEQLETFNQVASQTHKENVVKYGDENAFTFTRADLREFAKHRDSKIASPLLTTPPASSLPPAVHPKPTAFLQAKTQTTKETEIKKDSTFRPNP